MADVFGKPPIPPPVTHDKQIITRFSGWIVRNSSARGHHQFVIGVAPEELFKAMLMTTDKRLLHFEVYAPEQVDVSGDRELMKLLGLDVTEEMDDVNWEELDAS